MLRTAETPARKAEAEQMLSLAQTTRTSVAVKASFSGVVSSRTVSEGELIAENAELATVVDLSTVGFLADVQLRDLPAVAQGQHASVSFQAWPDRHFPAVVDAINPQTDAQSQTVRVRLRFLPSSLKAGRATLRTEMNGSATIVTGERLHALLIPKAAILRNDEDNTFRIVTITADSLSVTIPVEVGMTTDSTAEVRGPGIRKGMPVIIEGHYALPDSTRVTIPH
jgi:RND family efflux transporter MFP subunit